MNSISLRRLLIGSASACATLAAVTFWIGGPTGELIEHDEPHPYRTDGTEIPFSQQLEEQQPRIVILGNSITQRAVDVPTFQDLVGIPTLDLTIQGSASAIWYLLFKNLVVTADPRPKLAILGFRDVYLTVAGYRTTGGYKGTIDRYVDGDEPLLDRLAYFEGINPFSFFLKRHWSLYQRRAALNTAAQSWAKGQLAGRALGLGADAMQEASGRVFCEENMLPAAVNEAQQQAEYLLDPALFDFEYQLGRSFLPEMVRLAHDNNVQLVLVRMRLRRNAEFPDDRSHFPRWIHELLPKYDAALAQYLAEHGIPVVDFSEDERIPFEWFAAGDHLNADPGKIEFTKLYAEALAPLLEPAR